MNSVARVCSIEGCGRRHEARGYCNAHYKRVLDGRDLTAPIIDVASKKMLTCKHEGCEKACYCQGYCTGHYQRHRKGTPMDQPWEVRGEHTGCQVAGCPRTHTSRGYCGVHHARLKRGQDLETPVKERALKLQDVCALPVCENEVKRGETCTHHTNQAKRYGLEPAQYLEIVTGGCRICGTLDFICIDHDHECCPGVRSCGGCVRGGLCRKCNNAIGLFKDNPGLLRSAIRYLAENGID